jgi:hypothetical protein
VKEQAVDHIPIIEAMAINHAALAATVEDLRRAEVSDADRRARLAGAYEQAVRVHRLLLEEHGRQMWAARRAFAQSADHAAAYAQAQALEALQHALQTNPAWAWPARPAELGEPHDGDANAGLG